MLRPFWNGAHTQDETPPIIRELPYMRLTSLEECDFVVCPQNIDPIHAIPAEVTRLYQTAKNANKRFIAFSYADSAAPLPFENALIFRNGLKRAKRPPQTYACPAIEVSDLLNANQQGQISLRSWNKTPSVGFCGNVYELRSNASAWRKFWKTVGLRVVCPATALDANGLLRTAIR
ncbi:MAG TPA: hypothetical protein PLV25_05770, partial [Opitutales bacterium]|nr:hypothetical protein [Opitutales bacterium]